MIRRFRVDPVTGLVAPAAQCPSPNQDQRPAGIAPDLIVIHCISLPPGEFGCDHVRRLFLNCLDPAEHPYFETIAELQVSSHLLIARDGQLLQFVPVHRRAWHAGPSVFEGRERCNDFSVGIELVGSEETEFESAQYDTLLALVDALGRAYPSLAAAPITGHEHIAPGRKTDPGPCFDWSRIERAATMPAPKRPNQP